MSKPLRVKIALWFESLGFKLSMSIPPNMPQLLPFYFVNQLVFAFVVLLSIIYVFSKYILPMLIEVFLTRMYITKL